MNKLRYIFIVITLLLSMVSMDAFAKGKQKSKKKTTQKASSKPSAKQKKTTKKKTVSSKKSGTKNTTSSKKKTTTSKPTVEEDNAYGATDDAAQTNGGKDTTKPGVVVLYSAFKPTLRNAAKINFNAATPVLDTTKIPLTYVVPAQNLFFSYQPVPIKPLALNVDSSIVWQNNKYIKAGFGTFTTPYVEAGMSFGDGAKNSSTIIGKYTSSKGSLPFQQFSKAQLEYWGTYNNNHQQQWNTNVFYKHHSQYLYGYEPSTLAFTKDSLLQSFNTMGFNVGLGSRKANDFGISYHPTIGFNYYLDNRSGKELNAVIKAPIRKQFGDKMALDLLVVADITNFNSPAASVSNNLFYVNPSLAYQSENLSINAGIQPSWDNGASVLLPNITAEAKIKDVKLIFQAGWQGYFNKNSYQSLSTYNPYISQPTILFNTKISEQYFGIKGSAGAHLTYNAKLSFMRMMNQPLFININGDGKNYQVVNEPDLKAVKIHGELGYTLQEKFWFTASANIFQFTQITLWDKPFGLLPVELNGSLKWKILKDVHVKSDVFFFDGTRYLSKTLQTQKLAPGIDLNAGVEYALQPRLNLWLQLNNVLNNRYQRWNQYEVLGLHVLGGVVYSFK